MEQEPLVSEADVQKVVEGRCDAIWKMFSHILATTSANCRVDMLASAEKKATLLSHWTLFHIPLQGLMEPVCSDLEKVAAAHNAFVISDTWAYETGWDLLQQVVVAKCGMKIVEAWWEAVFSPEVLRDWLSWRKSHKSDTPDAIVNEEPVLSLNSLHDRHGRQNKVHKLFPILVRQIEEAWTARRQGTTREEILKRFGLLRQLRPTEFDELLNNGPDRDARTWAADIIGKRTHLTDVTIKKYGQPDKHRRRRRSGRSSAAA
jgi:hypothetical protein